MLEKEQKISAGHLKALREKITSAWYIEKFKTTMNLERRCLEVKKPDAKYD